MPNMRYKEIVAAGLDLGASPIPDWINDIHRSRILDINMFGARDWTPADWNVSDVGPSTVALIGAQGTTVTSPMLQVTCAAGAGNGYAARHNAKHLQMPIASQPAHFYVSFDIMPNSAIASGQHRAVGIATDTAANAFDKATGAAFTAGGGIVWQCVNSGTWSLIYKPTAKSAITVATVPANIISTSSFTRFGFMVVGSTSLDSAGSLYGFAHTLNTQSGNEDATDSASPLPLTAYYPPGGLVLNTTDHGDVAGANAGLFFGFSNSTASSRSSYIRRILAIDNLRR